MIQLAQANAVRLPLGNGVVSLCCTSPPYFSLRDYGIVGQMGLEKTPGEYIAKLVDVFREVRRVLSDDGLCMVNLGDSYASGEIGRHDSVQGRVIDGKPVTSKHGERKQRKVMTGIPAKNLCLIPQRAAIALQADGWWVRSFMPWVKNNCLPESVRDRPTTSHEYWIMLAKSKRYFWDQESVRALRSQPGRKTDGFRGGGAYIEQGGAQDNSKRNREYCSDGTNPSGRNRRTSDTWLDGLDAMIDEQRRYLAHLVEIRDGTGMLTGRDGEPLGVRFNTASYAGAHFATYPAKMIVPFIKAGSSERGVCPVCRRAWVRVVEVASERQTRPGKPIKNASTRKDSETRNKRIEREYTTTGWRATCNHDAEPIPALVLDPFVGSGTTLEVARSLGRDAVGFDLSFPYLRDQARERLSLTALDAWEQGKPGGEVTVEDLLGGGR